jgi:hypothetical protein
MTTYAYLRKDLAEAGEIPPTSLGYMKWDWDNLLFKVIDDDLETPFAREQYNMIIERNFGLIKMQFHCYSIDFDFLDESELQIGVYET